MDDLRTLPAETHHLQVIVNMVAGHDKLHSVSVVEDNDHYLMTDRAVYLPYKTANIRNSKIHLN